MAKTILIPVRYQISPILNALRFCFSDASFTSLIRLSPFTVRGKISKPNEQEPCIALV